MQIAKGILFTFGILMLIPGLCGLFFSGSFFGNILSNIGHYSPHNSPFDALGFMVSSASIALGCLGIRALLPKIKSPLSRRITSGTFLFLNLYALAYFGYMGFLLWHYGVSFIITALIILLPSTLVYAFLAKSLYKYMQR